MNATLILDRVKNPELLKNDKDGLWLDITTKFPYCTIAQWLKFGADKFSDKENLKDAFLYKSEPIEFASFLTQLNKLSIQEVGKEVKIQDKTSTEIPQTQSGYQVDTPEQQVQNAEVRDVKETVEADENLNVSSMEDSSTLLSVDSDQPVVGSIPDQPVVDETYAEILDEIREENSVEQEHVDILELINEIPNSTPFDMAEIHLHSMKENESEETEQNSTPVSVEHESSSEDDSDEDKSLMVMMSFTDWLNHFKQKSSSEREEVREKKALKTAWQKEKLAEAADEEVDEIPEPIFKQAMDSISMESSLISESLAEILAMQGKKDKAIAMYKKLMVRNPEKSAYFNQKIQDLNASDN